MKSDQLASEHVYNTDVLVVGAGPVGLLAAGELTRRGIACRIIDKNAERSKYSRALAIQPRTMEILDLAEAGLADEFVRRAYTSPGLSLPVDSNSGRQAIIDMNDLDTRFPFITVLHQAETEAILEAQLARLGVSVERKSELLGFTEQDGHVTAAVRLTDGREVSIRSRYLIGCDGAHSIVRHRLGLPFKGVSYAPVGFIGDAKVDGGPPTLYGRINNFVNRRGFAVAIPFKDGYIRIYMIDFEKQPSETRDDTAAAPSTMEPLTLADLQDSVSAIIPGQPTLREPRWLTRFTVHQRQVSTYQVGRVFLAGDSAHVNSPAGGQGMNTGLQDAFNISWKLALVLRGEAPERLLDSYTAERHPIGAQVGRTTNLLLNAYLSRNRPTIIARDFFVGYLAKLPPIRKRITEAISNVGISYNFAYPKRPVDQPSHRRRARQLGDRVPDLELLNGDGVITRLYELLQRSSSYTLFAVISLAQIRNDGDRLKHLLGIIKERYPTVQPYIVLNEGLAQSMGDSTAVLLDFKRQFQIKLTAAHESIVLMRPDAYLQFHGKGFDEQTLKHMLDAYTGPSHAVALPTMHPHPLPTI